jgi:hypothetical protein
VPLHHRHGPCSPVASKKVPVLEELLRHDQLRASNIQQKLSGARKGAVVFPRKLVSASVPTKLATSLDSLQYVITVRLGSPGVTQTVLMDTGSDVSWVQCVPCSKCYPQADPLFDPRSSSTYSPFPWRVPSSAWTEAARPPPSASTLSGTATAQTRPGLTALTRSRWARTPSSKASSLGAATWSRASSTRSPGS